MEITIEKDAAGNFCLMRGPDLIGFAESEADAVLIRSRVNAHAKLVDLLRDSSFMLQHQCADIGSNECVGCNQYVKIDQAIAKAEGGK